MFQAPAVAICSVSRALCRFAVTSQRESGHLAMGRRASVREAETPGRTVLIGEWARDVRCACHAVWHARCDVFRTCRSQDRRGSEAC